MSKGEQIIGGNPSGSLAVDQIKRSSIQLIDIIDESIPDSRRKAEAISKIEIAQMLAVRELFQPG